MELVIRSIGNSAGVVLPKEVLNRIRVGKGDKLYLAEDWQQIALREST